jgi:exoribonuclease-2
VYKNKPAVVTEIDDKLAISVFGGDKLRVREKDVELIHPGPCSPSDMAGDLPPGDVKGAWELLEGEELSFQGLAELVFGSYTPKTAWALCEILLDGLYFCGNGKDAAFTSGIIRRTAEEVAAEEKKRGEKQKNQAERDEFLARLKAKSLLPDDKKFLQDVEALAFGQTAKSRTLKDISRQETPEEAHRVLLETGAWTAFVNPHPARFGCPVSSAKSPVPPVPDEQRVDLTGLPAFAIDNAWSSDPDDAVSLVDNVLYVHVADPAASILPDTPADKEARARGATLYLPEGASRMVAEDALPLFALGLSDTSPALTFKITLNGDLSPAGTEIFPSLIRVTRLTYAEADVLPDLGPLFAFAEANLCRRLASGAISIDLPEAHISVRDQDIAIEPVLPFRSAGMVQECMLAAGEAAAKWALENRLPFPFVSQEPGDLPAQPLPGMAGSFQMRRCMRPRTLSAKPSLHWGLGLSIYTQVTSPLRRYTDLLAHQQIRAFLRKEQPFSEDEVLMRLAASDAAASATVHAERASRGHWTGVYLSDKKGSLWDGLMMEKRGNNKSVIMIPALAVETQVLLRKDLEPNEPIQLTLSSVRIPEAETIFQGGNK